jgi:hypothetical protein
MRPRWGSNPGLTDRLIVGCNVTLTLSKYDSSKNVVEWKLIESTESACLSDKWDNSSVVNEESQKEFSQMWGLCDY